MALDPYILAAQQFRTCQVRQERLNLLQVNIEPWLSNSYFQWTEELQTAEELEVAAMVLKDLINQRQGEDDRPSFASQVAGIAGSSLMTRLFGQPEWVSEKMVLSMRRKGEDAVPADSDNMLGSPWRGYIEQAMAFAQEIDQLSDRVAPIWLNLAIRGLQDASRERANPMNVDEAKANCHMVITTLLARCGEDSINEKLVGARWRDFLDANELAIIDQQRLGQFCPGGVAKRHKVRL